MSIYVARYPATNATRLGSIFLNPGGPGGSGSQLAFESAQNFSTVLKGQYDIVGFDPRGVKSSEPYVSCFDNLYEEEKFSQTAQGFRLNLPATITSDVVDDLTTQIAYASSNLSELSAQCYQRVGDALRYMGTEMVVHDIDFMTKAFDGPDARINYWGFSYGTIIGQYMVQMLSPERLGRIIIDGVVNTDNWAVRPLTPLRATAQSGLVIQGFVDSCVSAGSACAIGGNMTSTDIYAKLNATLDSLYASPVPVDVGYPATVNAGPVRAVMQSGIFSVRDWPSLASTLAQVFAGNYSTLAQTFLTAPNPNDTAKPDDSLYAGSVISCNDALQYGPSNPMPTIQQEVDGILQALEQNSPYMAEEGYNVGFCQAWPSLYPNLSRYNGSFGLPDGTLETPILILTQAYDPVSSYASAVAAAQRLGNNSRLLEQPDGFGHTTMSQMSWCTLSVVQSYMLYGEYPESNHTLCQVDQVPFVPWNASAAANVTVGLDLESRQAWADLNAALFP
ncbi:alpha/beta-hydrolase [Heliocybe sulcata]|uniref:Alpha/beta-hydrolase n=1 Tax=Heliocybe sulcata TaxID=5364 RepID=A0A5C3NDD0_9AGAM|nr:alpha/beta-hydrolase [Heliocybe sulcata]